MELPGDFFVDSMCVALPRVTRSCCHRSARGWWPVLAVTAGTGNQREHRELRASRSSQSSSIRRRFSPWGDGSVRGLWGLGTARLVPAPTGAAPAPGSSRETLEKFPLV